MASLPLPLHVFQAFAMTSHAAHSMDSTQHAFSHPANSWELSMARMTNLFIPTPLPTYTSLREQWDAWIQAESQRRLAWAILTRDVRSAKLLLSNIDANSFWPLPRRWSIPSSSFSFPVGRSRRFATTSTSLPQSPLGKQRRPSRGQ